MRQAFLLDLDGMEEFFKRVAEQKAETEEARHKIMCDLIKEHKAEYRGETNLSLKSLAAKFRNYGVSTSTAEDFLEDKGH